MHVSAIAANQLTVARMYSLRPIILVIKMDKIGKYLSSKCTLSGRREYSSTDLQYWSYSCCEYILLNNKRDKQERRRNSRSTQIRSNRAKPRHGRRKVGKEAT